MKSLFLVTLLSISSLQAEVRGWWDIAPREYPELAVNFIKLPDQDNGLLKLPEIITNLEADKHIDPTNKSNDSEWDDLQLLLKLGKPIDEIRLRNFLLRHAGQLKLIRDISSSYKLQHPENPASMVNFQAVMQVTQVVKLLELEHYYHLKYGNIDDAIDSINTFQKLNRKLAKIDGNAVCFLVICALDQQTAELIFKSLKHPSLSNIHLDSINSNLIPPSSFHSLIEKSLRYEFQFAQRSLKDLSAGGPKQDAIFNIIFSFENDLSEIFGTIKSNPVEQYFQTQLYKLVLSVGLQPNKTLKGYALSYSNLIRDLSEPLYSQKKEAITQFNTKDVSNLMGEFLLASGADPIRRVYYKQTTQNEVTQTILKTLLALRRFQLINGELPESLDLLIPKYLTGFPIDPYISKPFHYSKGRKLLWSVGDDLKNNMGISKESLEEAERTARKKSKPNSNKSNTSTEPYNKYRRSPNYINHTEHLKDTDEPHIVIPF